MKKKLIIILFIILSLVLIIGFLYYSYFVNKKHFKNDLISFKYDNIWKLKYDDNLVTLSKDNAKIIIYIKELDIKNINMEIETIKNIIKAEYVNYNLLFENTQIISSNSYLGANLILENDEEEILTAILKKGEYLVIVEYKNIKSEFDIYLDNIIKIISDIEIIGD